MARRLAGWSEPPCARGAWRRSCALRRACVAPTGRLLRRLERAGYARLVDGPPEKGRRASAPLTSAPSVVTATRCSSPTGATAMLCRRRCGSALWRRRLSAQDASDAKLKRIRHAPEVLIGPRDLRGRAWAPRARASVRPLRPGARRRRLRPRCARTAAGGAAHMVSRGRRCCTRHTWLSVRGKLTLAHDGRPGYARRTFGTTPRDVLIREPQVRLKRTPARR